MFRKMIALTVSLVFFLAATGSGLALEKGNNRKGKYSYRKVYSACFERGEVDTKTPPISPADKTQADWTTLFESQNYDEFGCKEEWDALSEEEVTDIYSYLHDFAADSPTPAKCK